MDYFDMDLGLSDEDRALKEAAHKFAAEVMRPAAREMDRMSAEEAVAEGSPVWPFLGRAYELGYHKALLPEAFGGLGLTPVQAHLVQEELAWGSFGFAAFLASAGFASNLAWMTGDEELIDRFGRPFCECTDGSVIGCWGVTEPDHGSDLMGIGEEFYTSPRIQGSMRARLEGDEWVINGQKAAWVSGAPLATHALLHLQTDLSKGMDGWGICIVPLDAEGASRGKPQDKVGQRELSQGELFFEEVRIPRKWMVVGAEVYPETTQGILAQTNLMMATWATGLARAAYEEALRYSKERIQGGRPLIEHYSMKQRIFEMFSRVETCRALSRAVVKLNMSIANPFLEYSLSAKTRCTQMCLENAHDAVQILGGNGLSKEYETEKLFRDARATLIMDGCNEVVARMGGWLLSENYPRSRTQIIHP